MSKKIYVPSSGLSHKTTKLRVGINNVSRNVVKGYIGINGSAKQFWPDEPIYVWNRYYTATRYSFYESGSYSVEFNTELSGKYSVTAKVLDHTGFGYLWKLYDCQSVSNISDIRNKKIYVYDYTEFRGNITELSARDDTATYNGNVYSIDVGSGYSGILHNLYGQEFTACGSYIDQVTSKIRGSYPDDGVQGGYWYVYVGER